MGIGSTANWYTRTDGSDNNGAGFDSGLAGAGTNYGDQAAAQATFSNLTTSGAGSTTLTDGSAGGLFTSQMVGNAIRIRSGTNFTSGYYFITTFTNSNNVVLDRSPTPGGAGASGAGNVGGASLTFPPRMLNSANSAGDKGTAGNTFNVRAAGGSWASPDYTFTGSITPVAGSNNTGKVRVVGYNGRPVCKRTDGDLIFQAAQYTHYEGIQFMASSASNNRMFDTDPTESFLNCSFNNADVDCSILGSSFGSGVVAINCEFTSNTATPTSRSTRSAVYAGTSFNVSTVVGCYFHDLGMNAIGLAGGAAVGNILYKVKNDGITLTGNDTRFSTTLVMNNTLDQGSGDGIVISQNIALSETVIINNIVSNHTGVGKYAINDSAAPFTPDQVKVLIDYNDLYNNTANYHNLSAGAHDLTLDPQYTNASGGDWSIGTNLKAKGFPLGGTNVIGETTSTYSYVDIGAAQRQEAGGGLLLNPINGRLAA